MNKLSFIIFDSLQKYIFMTEPTIDDLIKGLPTVEKIPVIALKNILDQRTNIDDQQEKQVGLIKKKYQDLLRPLLFRVSEIIQGGVLKENELSEFSQYLKAGQKAPNMQNLLKGKVIESFWNSVLTNSSINQRISEKDEKALEYLLDIQIVFDESGEHNNTSLKFIFKTNPYFNQNQLVRHLRASNGMIVCTEGDQITWKSGNCLTHEIKKVKNKVSGEEKLVQGKKISSFFDIFLDWNIENKIELQKVYEIMTELSQLIIKDSLSYFLGLIEPEFGEEEEEEEEDDNSLESEEEEEEQKSKPKSKNK